MNTKLTSKQYWEKYYVKRYTESNQIKTICGAYDDIWDKFILSMDNAHKKNIIEIGAFPGRYISYLSNKYNLIPTALDYNSNTNIIKKSFTVMGVKRHNIICKDFTTLNIDTRFDYVFSIGFIEHFLNYEKIMDNHLKLMKPGGRLLIMIPNKRGLRRLYGYLCDYENLKKHNLKCMDRNIFYSFAKKNNLKIIFNEYVGGFQYSVHQKINFVQKIIYKFARLCALLFYRYIKKNPHWLYSASLVAIFEKNE